jgi:hypothetical protein
MSEIDTCDKVSAVLLQHGMKRKRGQLLCWGRVFCRCEFLSRPSR